MDFNAPPASPSNEQSPAPLDLQQLRRQARQRFVGAAALVLAAVVILPFVLDTQPRPVSPNIAIDIQPPAAASHEAAPDKAANKPDKPTSPEPAALPAQAASASATPAATSPAHTTSTSSSPAHPSAAKPEAPPTPTVTKVDDGARAAALLNGSGYHIQAGSFTDKEKNQAVPALQAKLEKAGLKSYTQEAVAKGGVVYTRVRLGPFATQAEANQVAARIGKLGIKTIIVKS